MQESIQAAMTVVRSRSAMLGLDIDFYQKSDVHIHVPEGATPKDGPSAGAGMCTALISALTKIPVRSDVAMTGEITLRGEVLPIGGLKEKLLAAHRGGITTVLIPDENTKDLAEIPDNIKEKLDIRPVKWIDEVLQVALTHMPTPLPAPDAKPAEVIAGEKRRRKPARGKAQVRAH
jgi:ATP-dependent Lon protease